MAKITPEEVTHLAKLARLELSEEEITSLASELETIIKHVAELNEVAEEASPMVSAALEENRFREDSDAEAALEKQAGIKSFPKEKDGFLEVPNVF